MTRTDRHRGSGTASVLRCQRTPFRSTIAVLHCPRFRSTGRGKYRRKTQRCRHGRRARHACYQGHDRERRGVGGLAGQLTAGARRTSQVTYSAMGSPLATSGRFCRRIQPERPRSCSVSPGQQKSTADDACGKSHRNQGPMAKSGPISCRTAQKSHSGRQREQGGGGVFRKRLASRKVASETPPSLFPDQRHLNAGHPPFSLRILSSAFASWRAAAAG